jgi:hypothetical protein
MAGGDFLESPFAKTFALGLAARGLPDPQGTPVEGMEANHAMNAHEGDLIGSKATESLRLLPSAQPRTPGRTKKSPPVFSDTPHRKILSLTTRRLP